MDPLAEMARQIADLRDRVKRLELGEPSVLALRVRDSGQPPVFWTGELVAGRPTLTPDIRKAMMRPRSELLILMGEDRALLAFSPLPVPPPLLPAAAAPHPGRYARGRPARARSAL